MPTAMSPASAQNEVDDVRFVREVAVRRYRGCRGIENQLRVQARPRTFSDAARRTANPVCVHSAVRHVDTRMQCARVQQSGASKRGCNVCTSSCAAHRTADAVCARSAVWRVNHCWRHGHCIRVSTRHAAERAHVMQRARVQRHALARKNQACTCARCVLCACERRGALKRRVRRSKARARAYGCVRAVTRTCKQSRPV